MFDNGVQAVQEFTAEIQDLLDLAHDVKSSYEIEPPLTVSDFEGCIERIGQRKANQTHDPVQIERDTQAQYAAIDTAFRNLFYDLLASTSIEEPSFVEVWNLLDIVSIFSDSEKCDPPLIFWLIEELLDSQTINGCRKIFDYLESRRERLIAKNFKLKHLIILRSCNELLRRLSRAEDTVFCGRVFIFLFQSFPLGDRSSVNLRGEYHLENKTTFDAASPKYANEMDIDVKDRIERPTVNGHIVGDIQHKIPLPMNGGRDYIEKQTKSVTFDAKHVAATNTSPDYETLYPMFWALQQDFSNPTRLFVTENFDAFKKNIEATILKFQEVYNEQEKRGTPKESEQLKATRKRLKEEDDNDEFASIFNPKYLTSRDLFELEISDPAFRRHILVQALILMDFLLSLTPKAKAKLGDLRTPNKSVLYDYILSDEDAKWATQTRSTVAQYLQQGSEGKFYYRMVDTVLSRDKNWVRWKADNCPLIDRPPVTAEEWEKAKKDGQKATASKKLRSTPLGSLDLGFLSESDAEKGLERLRNPARWAMPTAESFLPGIANDEEDIKNATTDEERQRAKDRKASKIWRMMRVGSTAKPRPIVKPEDGNNLQALFEPAAEEGKTRGKDAQEPMDISRDA